MLNRHEQFKQALYAEENFTSHAMMRYPIEIEDTWLGRNMDVLIYALTGTDSIEPYNYVSFRVLQRMGDILMDRIDLDVIDTFQAGEDVIEKLKTNYREKLKARKRLERTYWEDPSPDFLSKLQQSTDQFNIFF